MDRSTLTGEMGGDPFIECEIHPDVPIEVSGRWRLAPRRGHMRGAGWVLLDAAGAPFGPTTAGDDDLAQAEQLIRRHAVHGQALTTDRGVWQALGPRFPSADRGGEWDWFWTRDAPGVHPREVRLSELDDAADAAELTALNATDSPTAESRPGTGVTELWIGARVQDRLVSAGALHRTSCGAPHLAGVVTAAAARGQGWGSAVVRLLTRRALSLPGPITGICTLGMYADNEGARRLYHAMGYRTSRTLSSRRLP